MGFFKNLFTSLQPTDDLPQIQFGRFSDSYKDAGKYDAWDRALQLFDDESYIDAYREFFDYLCDDDLCNVVTDYKEGRLAFMIYQGSKKIEGYADHKGFSAEAKIASFSKPNIAVFRKLLEDNFQMKYSKYAIDDNRNITAVFSTPSIDSSPYKLYYALKEMATHADRSDDVLINRYKELSPVNNSHIRSIPEQEKRIKYQYMMDAISEAHQVIDSTKLNISKHPGAVSYVYLDLVYRLDYLLKPEGYTMEVISDINTKYFGDSTKTVEQKNIMVKQKINQLAKLSYEDFSTELYEVKSTFGNNSPSGQTSILDFIASEITNMDWYLQNNYKAIALAIPSYITGYSLYSYAMPAPLRACLQLFYRVVEYPYFSEIGFRDNFVDSSSLLQKQQITRALKQIKATYSGQYEELAPKSKDIDFTNVFTFARTYMQMLSRLDFTRSDLR